MIFNTDSHFVIGRLHVRQNSACQDHALDTSMNEGKAAAIVISDGCSSGSYKDEDNKKVIHTDIGARFLTCSTIKTIKNTNTVVPINPNVRPYNLAGSIAMLAYTQKGLLGLQNRDMLATCVYAFVNQTGGFIHFNGDGCAVIKYRDGNLFVITLEWQNNMPYYPIYKYAGGTEFCDLHLQTKDGEQALKVVTYNIMNNELFGGNALYVPIDDAVFGYVHAITERDLSQIESVTIFSDGIEDFKGENAILQSSILQEFTSFKNYNGEFVKRRMSAALKSYAKEGTYPNDDLSMAVIHFEEEQPIEP